MAEKKNQHYVPKFLLRNFSNDPNRKLINIFNADTGYSKDDIPLKGQAQEDYFYGSDKIIEEALQPLEHSAAITINNIVCHNSLPKKDTSEYIDLFLFSFLLSYRTKHSVEVVEQIADKTFQELLKKDESLKHLRDQNLRLGVRNPAAHAISSAAKVIMGAYDLGLKLAVVQTKEGLVLSDNPSNRYNQYLEKKRHPGGHTGICSKGLQLFLPISPKHILIYYDKWAYKIGNRHDQIIEIVSEEDVEQLNYLQMVNCTEMIYHSHSTSVLVLRKLAQRAKKLRSKDLTDFYPIDEPYQNEQGDDLLAYTQHGDTRKFNLNLNFINQTKQAKQHLLSSFIVQIRNEKVRGI